MTKQVLDSGPRDEQVRDSVAHLWETVREVGGDTTSCWASSKRSGHRSLVGSHAVVASPRTRRPSSSSPGR